MRPSVSIATSSRTMKRTHDSLLRRQRLSKPLEFANSLKPAGGVTPIRCDLRERELKDAGGQRQVGDRRPRSGQKRRVSQSSIENRPKLRESGKPALDR